MAAMTTFTGGSGELLSATELLSQVNFYIRQGAAVTELQWPGEVDFAECRCKCHGKTVHGVPGGEGCDAKGIGTFGPIVSANDPKRPVKYCRATVSQRRADAALVTAALSEHVELAVCEDSGLEAEAQYAGPSHGANEFGAGYCFMPSMRGEHRARVSRVLGARPLVVDILSVVARVGRSKMKPLQLVKLSKGSYHVVQRKTAAGVDDKAGVNFVAALCEVLAVDPGARLGADMVDWLKSQGLQWPDEADADFALANKVMGTLPDSGTKLRYRSYSLVGDRFLKLVLAEHVLAAGLSLEEAARLESVGQSDAKFASVMERRGFDTYISLPAGVSIGSARVGGTALEVVIGLVYMHCGVGPAKRLMAEFEICGHEVTCRSE